MKKAADVEVCAHCGGRNPTNRCGRCGLVKYCSASCQRANWKNGGHKQACLAPEQRTLEAAQAAAPPRAPLAAEGDECAICLDPISLATAATLPCGHVFHPACVEGLRSFGVKQLCPMCRTVLPPGPQQLFEDGARLYFPIQRQEQRKNCAWGASTATEHKQLDAVLQLWTQAANQGHYEAQSNLWSMYESGYGVAQSYVEAVRWLRKAADQGVALAQCNLGIMHFKGQGVPQSDMEGLRWYQKAAGQGHDTAQFNLGIMYEYGQGVNQSDVAAMQWYRKAAEQGQKNAQFNLGIMYDQGRGVAQSDVEALRWYQKAAEQGHANAQCSLGDMYRCGLGVARSDVEAVRWLRKAADQGNPAA